MSAIAPTDIRIARKEQMFPQLTAAQIARLEPQGKRIAMRKGEVLIEPGQRGHAFLVVLSGALEIVRPGITGEGNRRALGREFRGG
jgi:CRP-like cAMP-binding protein